MLYSTFCFLLYTSLFWPSSSALDSFVEPDFSENEARIWSNDASITDIIAYEDGSLARLILKKEGNDSTQLPPFGCGFIRASNSTSYFLAVLLLGGRNTSAADQQVWLANRGNPIRENGTLKFTSNSGLALFDSNNTKVWSGGVSGQELEGLEIIENGKLQLYKGSQSFWQSFDEPTDTFLPGQKLYMEDTLIASASAEDWSSQGKYHVQMTSDGLIAFVQAPEQLNYFQLPEAGGLYRRRDSEASPKEIAAERANVGKPALNKGPTKQGSARGQVYTRRGCDCRKEPVERPSTYAELVRQDLVLTVKVNTTEHNYPVSPNFAAGSYWYLRLEFDGHFRTYQWQKDDVPRQVYDLIAREVDDCQHPHQCGDYGVCREGMNCSCPKALNASTYFKKNDVRAPENGCYAMIPFACEAPSDMVDFGNLSHFSFIDSQAADGNPKDQEGCNWKCRTDCGCRAAFFKFGSSTSYGECFLVHETAALSIRAEPIAGVDPYNSSAFIKVQLPHSASARHPASQPQPVPPSLETSRRRSNLAAILSGSLVSVLALFLSALCIVISRKKSQKKKQKKEERDAEGEDDFNPKLRMPRRFSYEQLRAATEDFKDRLGGGGFGTVFGGVLDSMRIAVKRLDNRGQGTKEFLAEVETIGNIHHVNLVRLIGFCAERSCKLLVYEYMSNGSLDAWIFNSQRNLDIDWQTRKKIILGTAKGLAYLHEECFQRIVHLDIKPQNILLDDDFNAKISDFGLSKMMDRDQSQVQTTIRGTPGYLAPEWRQLRITLKVDIYSFGIVVLEIICGRKNLDSSRSESSKHLLRLLQEKAEVGRLMDIVEGIRIDMQLHGDEVLKMIMLAIWCLQDDHAKRPQMSVVVKVLEGAMEVDPNINYRFSNAMVQLPVVPSHSDPPVASVLSAPR